MKNIYVTITVGVEIVNCTKKRLNFDAPPKYRSLCAGLKWVIEHNLHDNVDYEGYGIHVVVNPAKRATGVEIDVGVYSDDGRDKDLEKKTRVFLEELIWHCIDMPKKCCMTENEEQSKMPILTNEATRLFEKGDVIVLDNSEKLKWLDEKLGDLAPIIRKEVTTLVYSALQKAVREYWVLLGYTVEYNPIVNTVFIVRHNAYPRHVSLVEFRKWFEEEVEKSWDSAISLQGSGIFLL